MRQAGSQTTWFLTPAPRQRHSNWVCDLGKPFSMSAFLHLAKHRKGLTILLGGTQLSTNFSAHFGPYF